MIELLHRVVLRVALGALGGDEAAAEPDRSLRTLRRSPLHRLRLGTFAAIGMAFVVIRTWGVDPSEPTRAMLEAPFALLFLCLVGLRGAFELPAELPANWAFRFHTDASRLQRYLAGARKAAWLAAPLPLATEAS